MAFAPGSAQSAVPGVVLGHDHVFAVLGLVHQLVGAGDCLLHGLAGLHYHAADAGGQLQTGIPRHAGGVQLLPDAVQLGQERRALNARQHQQEFVAAVADEHVRFADAGAHHVNAGAQRHVAGLMAVGVVDQFKVVQIQHGHTGGVGLVLERVLKVEAVVAVGQCIVVELGVVARDAVYQAVPVFGVNEGLAVQLLDQLHDTGNAVDLAVDGGDLKDLAAHVFQLGALAVILQHLPGDAVPAGGVFAPIAVAAAKAVDGLLAADLRSIQQPHHSKDGAVLGHFRFDLFSGHSASAFV